VEPKVGHLYRGRRPAFAFDELGEVGIRGAERCEGLVRWLRTGCCGWSWEERVAPLRSYSTASDAQLSDAAAVVVLSLLS
jgi:hypothetical protein